MSEVAFVVDGDLEKRFLAQICKGSPVGRVGNGHRFPVKVLAKQIATHVRLWSNRYRHIVVIVDQESRTESAEEFRAALEEAVLEQAQCDGLHVFIKERMVEDWILADPNAIGRVCNEVVITDGLSGKGGLKFLLKGFGIKYNETTTGVELLSYVNCSTAIVRSPSLRNLVERFPIHCWWLSR